MNGKKSCPFQMYKILFIQTIYIALNYGRSNVDEYIARNYKSIVFVL